MHVYAPQGVRPSVGTATLRRPAGTGFAPATEASQPAVAPGAMRSIGGIDTLLALQGVEEPGERRQRAARQGRQVLDLLEELKLGLLSGTLAPATLHRLKNMAAELPLQSGDPRLDQVLAEIGLRACVELAKAGIR
jgi:hypothetical protein